MSIFGAPRLHIIFSVETRQPPVEFEGDPSSVVPASTLGNVLLRTNELMQATWDYAWWHTDDERFSELRRLEATGLINREDVELVVVSFEQGSLIASFDWSLALYAATALWESLPPNLAANALWDLAKYSFQSLWRLIRRSEDISEPDPLTNDLLPNFADFVRAAHTSLPDGAIVRSHIDYQGPDHEFSITIDKTAQETVLEANQVDIELATRLTGSIVGVDYSENTIRVQWEQFPEHLTWCDIGELDPSQVSELLPKQPRDVLRKVGFDVELAWRRGATKIFPPDSIRIIQIVPQAQLRNLSYLDTRGLRRTPTYELTGELNEVEQNFLSWLSWADAKWTDPNLASIASYLSKRSDILGRRYEYREIADIVKKFVQLGILLITQDSRRKLAPSYQVLRLNRTHPLVTRYLGSR